MGKASKFQSVLIYLFILSLAKKYSEVLYLLQTLVKNSGLIQVLTEIYFECNFSSCSSIFMKLKVQLLQQDSHCLFEQTEFIQWQVYCLFTSEIFPTVGIIENCKKPEH